VVNIYGGTYSSVAYNGQMFTIDVNEAEAVLGVINVYGGTFHNFDPANHTNDGTYTNKVMDGHHSIKDGDNYVVSEHTEVIDEAVAPTCTATGLTEGKHCSVCDKVLVAQEVVKALDHTYDQNNAEAKYLATSATCTEKATYYKSCSCGHFDKEKSETFESGEVDASAHDLKDVAAQAHTCTEDGWNAHKVCTRCDYTEGKEIDKAAHTEVVDAAVAPKCEETGLTEGKHCSVCGKVLIAQTVVDALGHE
jgi:hypothetical protein